jgi:predicted nuclease of predicted toxin-antitoxin system
MKILLDENIPIQLKKHLGETHEWVTVKELKIGREPKMANYFIC